MKNRESRPYSSRRSRGAGFSWAVAALAAGCGGAVAPRVDAPRAESSDSPALRRPDAVLLEPVVARPPTVAHADAQGVVALRTPIGEGAVAAVVRGWIDAWQRESLDALADMLSPDAVPIESSHGHGRAALLDSFRQRLQAHDYARLTGLEVLRPDRIERADYEDLAAIAGRSRPPEMRPDDLYIRVPLELTHVAGERLFGDVLVFVLRREDGKLRIAAYGEDDEKK
jgi:hypothetical protein